MGRLSDFAYKLHSNISYFSIKKMVKGMTKRCRLYVMLELFT